MKTVLQNVHDGSEIVFHLGGPNAPVTAATLRRIIPELRSRGFTFEK